MCLVLPLSRFITPRFNEAHGRVYYHNRLAVYSFTNETAEAVGSLSGVDNTQYERVDAKHVVYVVAVRCASAMYWETLTSHR